jgi:hypothetical protein
MGEYLVPRILFLMLVVMLVQVATCSYEKGVERGYDECYYEEEGFSTVHVQ